MDSDSRPLAVLIDGDNAQPSVIEHVLVETAKNDIATTRRIYGDWTTPQMSAWKDSLHSYAVQPIQQFRYTVGKNATDSAMIIDAMGPPALGDRGRLLHRVQRQRLHEACHENSRTGTVRNGNWAFGHAEVLR